MSGILAALAGIKTAIATAVDEYFNRTTLLLNTSSTNGAQNNTFLDSSTNNFTITRNGNTTQGTFTPFSQTGWGNFFNGTTDYLSPGTTATNFICTGTTSGLAATFEAWVFPTSWNGVSGYMNNTIWAKGGVYATFGLYNGTLQFFVNGGGTVSSSSSVSLNTWSYIAVTLNGATVTFYINGVSAGSGTLTGGIPSAGSGTSDYIAFQAGGPSNSWFAGYISNFRISNVVRTISTTPTTAFTSDGNTVVLSCQSNRFKDNSSNAFAITVNGTPSVQAFSPFAPTAAYDTAVVGGSGYYDGNGDYLSISSTASLNMSGDFTHEAWAYFTGSGSGDFDILMNKDINGHLYLARNKTGGNVLSINSHFVGNIWSGTTVIKNNTWYHLAMSRSGSTIRVFINGALEGSVTNSSNYTGTAAVYIGSASSTHMTNGYWANLRISTNARYTAAFSAPTAPFTSDANTALLCNFTNSGIFDSTAKNVLETVGNAQVSTTQAKWGTTSLYCPATNGNYFISPPNQQNFLFGTGNFTVEAWIYPTAFTNTATGLIGYGLSGGYVDWNLEINTSGTVLYIDNDAGRFSSSSNLSTNAWTHIAIVRTNTAVTMYFNGTSVGSYSTINNISGSSTSARLYVGTGAQAPGSRQFIGYIDDPRITKGYARYTANFTAPTAAFGTQ